MSADGRYVIFSSSARDLTRRRPGRGGLFLRDRRAKRTIRLAADGGDSAITANGRLVVYVRSVRSRGRYAADLMVRNLRSGRVQRVPLTLRSGARYRNEPAAITSLSADGQLVLVSAEGGDDLLVDRRAGVTDVLATPDGASGAVVGMSDDGRYVLQYTDHAYSASDTNRTRDCYRVDRQTGETVLASGDAAGKATPSTTWGCAISPQGHLVAFVTSARLIETDQDRDLDVYLKSLDSSALERIPARRSGERFVFIKAFSPDGRFLALEKHISRGSRAGSGAVQPLNGG